MKALMIGCAIGSLLLAGCGSEKHESGTAAPATRINVEQAGIQQGGLRETRKPVRSPATTAEPAGDIAATTSSDAVDPSGETTAGIAVAPSPVASVASVAPENTPATTSTAGRDGAPAPTVTRVNPSKVLFGRDTTLKIEGRHLAKSRFFFHNDEEGVTLDPVSASDSEAVLVDGQPFDRIGVGSWSLTVQSPEGGSTSIPDALTVENPPGAPPREGEDR